jgi:hypothetical protein
VTSGTKPPLAQLATALFATLLLVASLTWALFAPARARAPASRPPLPTPVALDWLNDPKPLPAVAPPTATPSSTASVSRDGLKAW